MLSINYIKTKKQRLLAFSILIMLSYLILMSQVLSGAKNENPDLIRDKAKTTQTEEDQNKRHEMQKEMTENLLRWNVQK